MSAPRHDQFDVLIGGFHHVCDEGMAQAVQSEAVVPFERLRCLRFAWIHEFLLELTFVDLIERDTVILPVVSLGRKSLTRER